MKEALECLKLRAKIKKPFSLTVAGTSMFPLIREGESISICRKDAYDIGDILVFIYPQDRLIVHRLLKIQGDRYFCKGDNCYELEEIGFDQIIGAVLLEDDPHHTAEFVRDSYHINCIFRECDHDIGKTKQTEEYQAYYKKYLEVLS